MTPALVGTLQLVGFVACIGIVFVTAHHPRRKRSPHNEDDR
jgi:hypothetical protein